METAVRQNNVPVLQMSWASGIFEPPSTPNTTETFENCIPLPVQCK
jgi:hypothetical protein